MNNLKKSHWLLKLAVIGTLQFGATHSAVAEVSIGNAPTVIINEVMPANFSGDRDTNQKYKDWVELYNTTAAPIDLAGWGLSNKTKSPFRWVFPAGTTISAKGYLRVWLNKHDDKSSQSNLSTNFNVDNGNDDLVLSAPNQTLKGVAVDMITLPMTQADVSVCRSVNGVLSPLAYCKPTAGGANDSPIASVIVDKPTITEESGVYASGVSVTIEGPEGAALRYTLDGSEPTADSTLVNGNTVSVGSSATLRVAAFEAGKLPSLTETATYIIDGFGQYNNQQLLFIAMKPTDARTYKGRGSAPDTWWKSHVEMIGEDGKSVFKMNSLSEEAGQIGSRRGQDVYPMDIKFTDVVGGLDKDVEAQVFSARPNVKKFDKLRLRNSGHDYNNARLRDHYLQSLGEGMDVAPGAYEPVQVFVNAEYHGLLDLRQKEDETLIEATYGVDKDSVDYLSDSKVLEGEFAKENFKKVYNLVTRGNLSDPDVYEEVKSLLDVENLVLEFSLHMFAATSVDWQWRNMHYFGMPTYDGKWRYRVHDFDIAADYPGFSVKASRDMNSLGYGGHESGSMMRALLKSEQFKAMYAGAIADQLNSALLPSESAARLLAMSSELAKYMPNHIRKNADPSSLAVWEENVATLGRFMEERVPYYEDDTKQYLNLSNRVPVTLSVNDTTMGTVKVNTLDLSTRLTATAPAWSGKYYPDYPIKLEAKPKPGFKFVRWEGSDGSTARTITPTISNPNLSYKAVFEVNPAVEAPVVSVEAMNHLSRYNNKTTLEPLVPIAADAYSAKTGDFVLFQLQATDPNGYPLTFKEKKFPKGIVLHPDTGMVSGKFTRGGDYASTVTVTNGITETKISIDWSIANEGDRLVTLPTGITGDGVGLKATYYGNEDFTGEPSLTNLGLPSANYGSGARPLAGFSTSNWAIRWEGVIEVPTTGTYSLQTTQLSNDGVRIFVDGQLVADNWAGGVTNSTADVTLSAGVFTPIKVEFRDISSSAQLAMNWKIPGDAVYQPVPLGVFNPVAPVIEPPVNVAPEVVIAVPNADQTLTKGDPYTLTANASDTDGNVTKVEIYNGAALLRTITAAPYTISGSTESVPVGVYTITAKAYDDKGAVTTSAPVNVTVKVGDITNNVAPTVAITTPSADQTLTKGDRYAIKASAADVDGNVTKVEFYNGSSLLTTLNAAPFEIGGTTESVPVGTYTITAKAYDDDGAVTTSAPVVIKLVP